VSERYRVVTGFELTAESADAAYAEVARQIGIRNAQRPDSDLRIVIGPRDRTEVYGVAGEVTPRPRT
jgi:hypothetical protein